MTGAGTEDAISPSLVFPAGSVLGNEPEAVLNIENHSYLGRMAAAICCS